MKVCTFIPGRAPDACVFDELRRCMHTELTGVTGTRDRRGGRVRRRRFAALTLGAALMSPMVISASDAAVVAAGVLQTIPLEAPNNGRVILGSLASRSQMKPVTATGTGPYVLTGTDSVTGLPYTFETDVPYLSDVTPAYGFESDERALTRAFNSTVDPAASHTDNAGVERTGAVGMTSNTQCAAANSAGTNGTYCSTFGPEVYSAPFQATAGQAIAFQWSAVADEDDYEIYAFLIKVDESAPGVFDYGTPASHTLLTYGRGATKNWTSAGGSIPTTGSYRFRFVNGSYDATGGRALGSVMYVDSAVKVGLPNPITFAPIDPQAEGVSLSLTATAPGGPVTLTSNTPGVCTVDGNTVTVIGAAGQSCTITANQPGDGSDYIPADSLSRTFTIAGAPSFSAPPTISGTPAPGAEVTLDSEGTWSENGSSVTETTIEWLTTLDGGDAFPSGVTGTSCVLFPMANASVTVAVTKTNAFGSTTGTSTDVIDGYVCALAPVWTDDVIEQLVLGVEINDGVAANASPNATFTVTAGTLPAGLTLDPITGSITGTPTKAENYSFTITATNDIGSSSRAFAGSVASLPVWTDDTIVEFQQGMQVIDGVTASAVPAVTYAITEGALPAGLVLDPATGAITGIPTTPGAYSFTVTATNVAGSVSLVFAGNVAELAGSAGFVGIIPARLLDTRESGTKSVGGSVHELTVVGVAGVPADAFAVVLNVTATNPEADGFITVFPCGGPVPTSSNVNFVQGQTVPNSVTSAVGAGGKVCFYTMSTTHLVVDVNGAYSQTEGLGQLVGLSPVRLLDTRESGVKVKAGDISELNINEVPGLPTDASAVVLNVTATESATDGYITVFPCGGAVPTASNVNFVKGQTVPNSVTVAIGDEGGVCFFSTADSHLVIDLNAVYSVIAGEGQLVGLTPNRLLDTRESGVKIAAGATREITVAGVGGVPTDATAVLLNVTATESETAGFITVFPCGDQIPTASNVNFVAGQTVPNLATTAVGTNGKVCFYTMSTTHLVVDVTAAQTS